MALTGHRTKLLYCTIDCKKPVFLRRLRMRFTLRAKDLERGGKRGVGLEWEKEGCYHLPCMHRVATAACLDKAVDIRKLTEIMPFLEYRKFLHTSIFLMSSVQIRRLALSPNTQQRVTRFENIASLGAGKKWSNKISVVVLSFHVSCFMASCLTLNKNAWDSSGKQWLTQDVNFQFFSLMEKERSL